MPTNMMIDVWADITGKQLSHRNMMLKARRMQIRKRLAEVGGDDELDDTAEAAIEDYEEAIAVYSFVHEIALTKRSVQYDCIDVED